MLDSVRSRGMEDGRAERFRSLLPIPIGSLLAIDTTRCPWHGREPLGTDRRFAFHAGSKLAAVNPAQCVLHVAQQAGFAIHVSNRQISFRRQLNLVHLVRALLDGDAVPLSHYLSQLGLFSFENRLEPVYRAMYCLHAHPSSPYGRSILLCTGWSITEPP